MLTANPGLVGVFADNNTSGTGAARAIKDNKAADRIPVVAFDTDPQENAALTDGSIDALVVQNPYFFGYQGVVQAGMAAVGSQPPLNLDPGAVVADKTNMGSAVGQAAAEPADREGPVVMGATVTPKPAPTEAQKAPVVSLRDAAKAYGPIKALHGVTLELRAGEVMCLAGENGAGKSTLIKILTGAIRRDDGEYLIDGAGGRQPQPRRDARGRHRRRLPGAEPAARPVGGGEPAHGAPARRARDHPPRRAAPPVAHDARARRPGLAGPRHGGRPRCRWPSASSSRSPRCSAPTRAC